MGSGELAQLSDEDLIDDRALLEVDDDALDAQSFVSELANLCSIAKPPAAVALYGSWGTGKSSIGNLLEKRLKQSHIAFARFDAFKWAEIPLKRRFLSVIASQFGIDREEFHSGLYVSNTTNKLRIPKGKSRQLLSLLGWVAIALLGLLEMVSAIRAGLVQGDFLTIYANGLAAGLGNLLIAAPLVTAVLALLGKQLTLTTTRQQPSDDEEFAHLFSLLLEEVAAREKADRVVIFIDELDRCSPAQVATTLEAIRTFLDVSPCITIIAADQQVLEFALTEKVRQATPPNAVNPYYSSGSAYLDKIFQYQVVIPPLMPRRLTRFALDLVENRGGTWEQVPNLAQVVSILIPAHVSSPRRVKHLLNAFILLFRAALLKQTLGSLTGDVAARASEIAKLAALQVEFPLFARDLQLDYRITELLTRRLETPDVALSEYNYPGLAPETIKRVEGYLKQQLPPDHFLSPPEESD